MMTSNLNPDNHVNMILPGIYNRINSIRNIQNVTNFKTRLELANGIIIGKGLM